MGRLVKYLLLPLILYTANIVRGQESTMLKQFLTVDNGLSHNEVTAIVQDNNGFMWIGTRGGLNRYDGYEFKVFNQVPDDPNSLVNPSIESLFIDSKENIWIGTKSGGVSKYNPTTGKFTNFKNTYKDSNNILPSHRVLCFYEDKKGRIWMGTWSDGLFVYDEENNETKQYLPDARVNSIVESGDNRIWVGTSVRQGLFEYIEETDSMVQRISSDKLFANRKIVYDEPRNVLWIVGGDNVGAGGSKSGLIKFDLRNNKTSNYKIEDSNINNPKLPHSYYSLYLDKKGEVWIGTWGTGLYIFHPEEERFERRYVYPESSQYASRDYDAVLAIFNDKDNNLWLGTNGGGICLLTAKLGFNSVGYNPDPNKGLVNTRVMTVLDDRSGNLWIGTIGGGLMWSPDRENYYQVDNPSLINKSRFFVIKYLFQDKTDRIWVGTNIGVFYIRYINGVPQMARAKHMVNTRAFSRTMVSCLEADSMLWIGTLQQGLYLLDSKTYQQKKHLSIKIKSSGDIKGNRISYMFQDSRERIWLGTYNGLHIYNKEDTTIHIVENYFDVEGEFTGNIITSIDEDKKGNIWVGTPNGLNQVTQTGENKFQVIYKTDKDGLASNFVKGIACDLWGDIWFSTNTGITKYNTKDDRFINFNETDGIRGKNFTEASVYRTVKGEIFFGGTHGLTYFNPEDIVEHRQELKAVFTGLSVLNEPVEIGKKYGSKVILDKSIFKVDQIELPYNKNKLEIRFSALDYISRGTNNYAFFLENFDEDWNYIGTRRFIIFNNLKPGNYNLKIRSSNRHNVWNEEASEIRIVVKPPFWRTWYALLTYILFAIGIITIIRWNAIKQVRLANSLELEKMQHEQDQRLNEMKIRFFTNISHEFRTPLTLILAPLKEILSKKEKYKLDEEFSNKLGIIQNNSLRLMRMVNQLLDFRKAESGNMKLFASLTNLEDFVAEVCYPFEELANINNISFRSKSLLSTKELWFDRDKLEIVLNNLISNAFKYIKEKGKIEVTIYEEEEEVLLSVSDNGPGIPSGELRHIFERFYRIDNANHYGSSGIGLALTKRIVELHGGSISVSSEANVNTEFIVSLPKGNAHLKPEEMVEVEKNEPGIIKKDNLLANVLPLKTKHTAHSDVRILVVDDKKEIRDYLVEMLKPFYEVDTAENGMEGLARVKENIPDLIISDVMMPRMDGFEFCKRIRSRELTSTLPFIFLTAKNDEQFRLLGTQAGANDYISKPFDPTLLLEKVKNILERHKKLQIQYSKSVRLEPSDIEITSSDEVFISKVIEIIEKNMHNSQFSSEVLAAELNRSYSSLYRKLKKLTGLSAAEFIRSIRIKRAAQLLVDKEKTISEIAYEVGFNDVKHFRTVFQKQFDCSPSTYRQNL